MSSSGSNINYNLRPAKSMERRMICDALRRLTPFGDLRLYRYIGFGSFYFADFVLIHKALAIENMVNIESDTNSKRRYEFNCPYKYVRMRWGHSAEELPKELEQQMRTILWLDYDGKLTSDVLLDVRSFAERATTGSVLIVSVNVVPDPLLDGESKHRRESLAELVTEGRVPIEVTGDDLGGWGLANVCHRIITNEICNTIETKNDGLPNGARFSYKQLFNFHYADDAQMLTVGGLLYDKGQEAHARQCMFDDLPFIRDNYNEHDNAYRIEVPILTYREINHLNASLPIHDYQRLSRQTGIPVEAARRYAVAYRYFPTYVQLDI